MLAAILQDGRDVPASGTWPIYTNRLMVDDIYRDGYRPQPPSCCSAAVVPTVLNLISDGSASMTGAVIERRLFPATPA